MNEQTSSEEGSPVLIESHIACGGFTHMTVSPQGGRWGGRGGGGGGVPPLHRDIVVLHRTRDGPPRLSDGSGRPSDGGGSFSPFALALVEGADGDKVAAIQTILPENLPEILRNASRIQY